MNKEQKYTKQQLKQIEDLIKKKIENASQEELLEANAWIKGYECCDKRYKKKLEQLKKKPQKVSSFSQDKPDYKNIKNILNKIVLIERYDNSTFSYFIVCKDCGTISYGDGNCHCKKNNWIIDEKELIKKIKELRK